MRVLLVEDSTRLQAYLAKGLRRAGLAVDAAGDGETGLWQAESQDYDVVVLDLMLPKKSGMEVLRQLRGNGSQIHILILTAKDAVEDRVQGLNAGADDYLVKPFAFPELLARIQALARRNHGVKSSRIDVGDLSIRLDSRTAYLKGEPVELQPLEFSLLEYLAMRKGRLVSRTEIEEHLWDDQVELMSNAVDAKICRLRGKLDKPGARSMIQTRRGEGYLLRDPNE